ncbi:hypothetical protein BB561_005890 [Smittium simulii]|uniref:Metallo-beta-lactamase domain-containing protein n=1 Tax=Smittium simulii TaxID=133385 RepID=A0A2T9Y7S2_9FUNG|nr:hypothetical protein BB561_005890 [Smittium simulii]
MKILPLGAGQEVGRSCLITSINGKRIMFDCGMHMGYNDDRRFPDFSYLSKTGNFTRLIDAVIISHFHLDHCGALPYFTEICGYDGPIYMTAPTKAIVPILLEDFRKIVVNRYGESNFFTSDDIKACMNKVIVIGLHETILAGPDLELTAYYAGHVLGAAMINVRSGNESVLYTGDYNMTPDRHLGSASVDRIKPTVLITESTYGTTIRDSKRARERDFLEKVHRCIKNGGKVLIPCFALGRAQELCILIESYWERMGLEIPVYFSAGLTERANRFYKLFINWTNQKVKSAYTSHNPFDFKYIKPWKHEYADLPTPMVVFATPGMLHIGMSLEIFKKWAPDPKNMLIIPGYCVAGTVGAKVLAGYKVVDIDAFTKVSVNMQVENLSFSAHADAKGIMELIRQAEPANVVLVHGEKSRMSFLKSKVMSEFGLPCYDPANGETLQIIETAKTQLGFISTNLIKSSWETHAINCQKKTLIQFQSQPLIDNRDNSTSDETHDNSHNSKNYFSDWTSQMPITKIPINGLLVKRKGENTLKIVTVDFLRAESSLESSDHQSGPQITDIIDKITKTPNINQFFFTTLKPFDGINFENSQIAKQYNLTAEMVALLSLQTHLKAGYGISGELVVYCSTLVQSCNSNMIPIVINSDVQKNLEQNSNLNTILLQESEKHKIITVDENLEDVNKKIKLGSDNSAFIVLDSKQYSQTTQENGLNKRNDDNLQSKQNLNNLVVKNTDDQNIPEFITDFGCTQSSKESHSKLAANLTWCGISVGIIKPELKGEMLHLDLLQVSWEINDEQSASLVLSILNKILQ